MIEQNEKIIKKIEKILLYLYKYFINCKSKMKLINAVKCFNGGNFKSSDYTSWSKEKLITIKNISDDGFNSQNATYFSMKDKYEKYKLNIGDILLTMTGAYVGRIGIVDEENCFLNQRVLKIDCISKSFIYIFLKTNRNEIYGLAHGSAQPNLSLENLYNMDLDFSYKKIEEFKKYDYLFWCIVNKKKEIKKLKRIKEQLLDKYF